MNDAVLKGLFGDADLRGGPTSSALPQRGAICLVGGVTLGRAVGTPQRGGRAAPFQQTI
jgi:hypothetical protein